MKKSAFLLLLPALLLALSLVSCKKCYDCTRKCGTCTKGLVTMAGCEGDPDLGGRSVDTWKIWLESDNYACTYNNQEEEACGADDRKNKEKAFYECVAQ